MVPGTSHDADKSPIGLRFGVCEDKIIALVVAMVLNGVYVVC